MAYATGTLYSALTPAKDFMAAVGPALTAGGLSLVDSYSAGSNGNWNAVAYGNGMFVAVAGSTPTVASSPDGITWTQRTLPVSALWSTIAYGNGVFVALAQNSTMAATSPDGITWTVRGLPAGSASYAWTSVTYGGGQFLAVANNANFALASPDGIAWTQRGLLPGNLYTSVAYGNGVFVAVNSTANGLCQVSADGGGNWTARNMPASVAWSAVTYGGGLFVAVANGTTSAASSPDGVTWTPRTMPSAAAWQAVTYGGGVFAAVATGTAAASSPDGTTWLPRTLPSNNWLGVAYGGGMFAAVAISSAVTASSPDGFTWTQRAMSPTSSSAVSDVYRSPAASNTFGQDWYLILRRGSDLGNQISYQVAEQYNAVTHRASNYGGTGVSVVPAAGTYANPAAPASPETSAAVSAIIAVSTTINNHYWVSANPNRVVISVRNSPTGVESGFYAGLYDDALPSGVTQFPLVCAQLPTQQSAAQAIGGATANQTGGFTREPLQAAATANNFEARIHNTYYVGAPTPFLLPGVAFTPTTGPVAPYGNYNSVGRVMLGSGRSVTNLADALRGVLIGCVTCQAPTAAGDTITSGGKTYVRVHGVTATSGIFVDQGA